jgi:hypothetical protein
VAKIGVHSSTPQESGSSGHQSGGRTETSDGGGPSEPSGAAIGAPGSFGAAFVRMKQVIADNYSDAMTGYGGTFNSETAFMEIRGGVFTRCAHHREISAECGDCGRVDGNNISVLSGRGDGLYSGLNYWASSRFFEDRNDADLLASLYLFDRDIAYSLTLAGEGWADPEGLFIQLTKEYAHLPGSVVGEIQAGPDGFWVGDKSAESGSTHALIDHWGSQNKTFVVVCFFEPIDPSKMYYSKPGGEPLMDAEGNLRTPVRPRIVWILDRAFATTVFGDFSQLSVVSWREQPTLWFNMIIDANAVDNGVICVFENGQYWNDVYLAYRKSGGVDFVSRKYRLQALGYFLQGALLGDERSLREAKKLLLEAECSPVSAAEMKGELLARGQEYDDNARRFIESLQGL